MAENFKTIKTFPTFKNFTGALTWTEVQLPSVCSRVQVGSDGAKLYVSHDGADGGSVSASNDKGFIPQNNYLTFHLGRGSSKDSVIYVAAASGNPDISIILEEL